MIENVQVDPTTIILSSLIKPLVSLLFPSDSFYQGFKYFVLGGEAAFSGSYLGVLKGLSFFVVMGLGWGRSWMERRERERRGCWVS